MPTSTVYLLNLSKSYEYFQQKQEELKTYQVQLKTYRENIKLVFFFLKFFSLFDTFIVFHFKSWNLHLVLSNS
jgi:hypothetical protein